MALPESPQSTPTKARTSSSSFLGNVFSFVSRNFSSSASSSISDDEENYPTNTSSASSATTTAIRIEGSFRKGESHLISSSSSNCSVTDRSLGSPMLAIKKVKKEESTSLGSPMMQRSSAYNPSSPSFISSSPQPKSINKDLHPNMPSRLVRNLSAEFSKENWDNSEEQEAINTASKGATAPSASTTLISRAKTLFSPIFTFAKNERKRLSSSLNNSRDSTAEDDDFLSLSQRSSTTNDSSLSQQSDVLPPIPLTHTHTQHSQIHQHLPSHEGLCLASDEILDPSPDSPATPDQQQYQHHEVSLLTTTITTTTSISTEPEDDESEAEDEFDPLLFIATLPASPLELKGSQAVLPLKGSGVPRVTLVLDLDETLVHCSTEKLDNTHFQFPVVFNEVEYRVNVSTRPYYLQFLKEVSHLFEIVVFTASQEVYAKTLLDLIDQDKVIQHRLYRDSCVCVEGNYLKDLRVLGRDMNQVVIIDNSPQAFGFQVDNGIPILSYFEDAGDAELLKLIPFLKQLSRADDVRPLLRDRYRLSNKVDQYKTMISNYNSDSPCKV